jgi:hypothetical protein
MLRPVAQPVGRSLITSNYAPKNWHVSGPQEIFRRAGFPTGAFQTLLLGSARVARVIADERVRALPGGITPYLKVSGNTVVQSTR